MQFQKLLPRGRVWHRGWGTVQAEDLLTLMPTWARLDARAGNLLTDAFPCTTDELLPEWEATLGLPDPCTGPLPTIQQRVLAVCAKFSNTGGQSMQYFIDLAETLGFKITITTYSVFRTGLSRIGDPLNAPAFAFAWGVTLVIDPGPPPSPTPIYFRTGASGVGEPLMYWNDELMRCMFEALKPAHTSIIWISWRRTSQCTASIPPSIASPHFRRRHRQGTPAYFSGGNVGTGVQGTIVDADWANAVQEEIAYTVTQSGQTLSKTWTRRNCGRRSCSTAATR